MAKPKYILVPVDFSDNSIHALNYAIQFANTLKYNLRLIHVRNKQSEYNSLNLKEYDYIIKEEIKAHFLKIINSVSGKIKGTIDYYIREGKVHNEICNQALYTDAEMIIMGTHGIAGFEERWAGSNAFRVVSHAPCPVISLRADFKIRPVKCIVMPIDLSEHSTKKVTYVAKLAQIFNSKIEVVDIRDNNRAKTIEALNKSTDQIVQYLKRKKIECSRKSIKSKHQSESIIEYALICDSDIITMIIDDNDRSKHLITSANAQQMVNHSPIPILSISNEMSFI